MTLRPPRHPRRALAALLLATVLPAVGCGREAPAPLAPDDDPVGGAALAVDSDPAGATILLDGAATGETTPHTFTGLAAGPVTVSLELPGHLVAPAAHAVTLVDGETAEVPAAAFTTRSRRLVLLEGFANIDCGPCPQLTANLLALADTPGYGPGRIVFVEYAVFWPNFLDPFYQHNDTENNERITAYGVPQAPTLVVDGATRETAVDLAVLRGAVDASHATTPDLLVDVAADLSSATVPATVTLTALADVDLTGHTLWVGLYQEALTIEPAPGTNGQTAFHHVFRDRADTLPALGPLSAGVPQAHEVVLQRDPAWGLDGVEVYAFVQRDADRAVVQAGSLAATALAPATLFVPAARGETP